MRTYAGKTSPAPSAEVTKGRPSFLARRDDARVAELALKDAERAAPARAPFDGSRIPVHPPSMPHRLSTGPPGGDPSRGQAFFQRIGLAGRPAPISRAPTPALALQRNANVSSPGDPHEREADEVAETIMRMAEPAPVAIHRTCAACQDEEKKTVHQKRAPSVGAGLDTAAAVRAAEHGGEALPEAMRDFFGPFFGHDLGSVRVHAGADASRAARAVQARAYTIGHDIVFDDGQYAPHTAEGKRLLAHELTHVVQQRGLPSGGAPQLQRQPSGGPSPSGAGSSDCGPDFNGEFSGEINDEQPEAHRGVPRQYYAAPPRGADPGTPVEAIVTGTQVEVGQKGGYGGLWRAVCTRTSKMPTQILWVLGEYVLNLADKCVLLFNVTRDRAKKEAVVGLGGKEGKTDIRGHHKIEIKFADQCGCSNLEYRQFIAGIATMSRAGEPDVDLTGLFKSLPGGLPQVMTEDGKKGCIADKYGHRDLVGMTATGEACPEDRYVNAAGDTDQKNGCEYRSEDFPKLAVDGLQSEDVVYLRVDFEGRILRNGKVIKVEKWIGIDEKVSTP